MVDGRIIENPFLHARKTLDQIKHQINIRANKKNLDVL